MSTDFPSPTEAPDQAPPNLGIVSEEVPNPWFTGAEPPPETPQDEQKRRPRLGENRASRGGPRQLTKKDLNDLLGLYMGVGATVRIFKPKAGEVIATQAESCVEAWEALAKQNDSVRRALLALLEGGAWSLVISAHLPIILSMVPERVMESMPLLFGEPEQTDEEDYPYGRAGATE